MHAIRASAFRMGGEGDESKQSDVCEGRQGESMQVVRKVACAAWRSTVGEWAGRAAVHERRALSVECLSHPEHTEETSRECVTWATIVRRQGSGRATSSTSVLPSLA